MNGRNLALLTLLLAPLLWLWPSVFGGRTFVPYDLAAFPPASLALTPEQLADAQAGANTDPTEPPVWFVPELRLAQSELAAGRAPTWNPHARFGAPLHAHGLIGLCYPPVWLALAADDPADGLVWLAWVDLALGGVLAFGLLRALGLTVLPAWFGALLFQLSGPMAANAFFWMRLGSYVWLPGVLWAVHATVHAARLRARHVLALPGAFALTWLAGFPPFAATTTLLGGAFAAWLLVARARTHGHRAVRTPALRLLAGFALGACLALPQVLPSLRFFPESARPTQPAWQDIAGQSFEVYGLLGYLLPDALGHPDAKVEVPYGAQNVLGLLANTRRDAAGKPSLPNFNYTEYAVFVGQLGLLLALLGALAGRGAGRAFALTAWLVCGALALFVPGARALFHLPLVENVWPLRWLAPATLFVAWLAAIGLARLLAGGRALAWTGAAVAALLAAAVATTTRLPLQWHAEERSWSVHHLAAKFAVTPETVVGHVMPAASTPSGLDRFEAAFTRLATEGSAAAWWLAGAAAWFAAMALLRDERRRRWLALAAGAAAALQLGAHGATVTRGMALAHPTDTAVHAFLRARAADAAASGGFTIVRGAAGAVLPDQLPPGELLVPGVRDLHFYTHYDGRSHQPLQRLLGTHLGTLHLAKGYLTATLPHTLPTPDLARAIAADPTIPADFVPGPVFAHPLLDLLGVRYVLSVGDAPLPDAGAPVVIPDAPRRFVVQERATALPRAFAVSTVVPAADDAAVLRALLARDFAPRRVVHALASDLPAPLPAAAPADAPPRAVTFVRDAPTRIELDVAAGVEPWLLLTDTFLPGWTATIDGAPAPIVRGDHFARLVQLPPSACRVVFEYHAPGLAAGLALAAFAALALAVWAFATVRRRD